ncbi:hypothetical protein YC2023_083641 [Brassica napus]
MRARVSSRILNKASSYENGGENDGDNGGEITGGENDGSESVNETNAGRKSLVEDKGPDVPAAVPADASSSKDKAPEPSLSSRQTTYEKVVRDKQGLTII